MKIVGATGLGGLWTLEWAWQIRETNLAWHIRVTNLRWVQAESKSEIPILYL